MEIIILFLICMGYIVSTNAVERGVDVPLPTEHYDDIAAGSIISVKIHGRNYIEYGLLYEKPEDDFGLWSFSDRATPPFGPERLYMVVVDPGWRLSRRPTYKKDFAANLQRRYVSDQQDPEHPFDMLFIINNNKIFYATLSTDLPNTNLPISAFTLIDVSSPNAYKRLHGSLKVWDPSHRLPNWVLKKRQSWL